MFAAWPGLGFPAGYDVLLLEGGAVKGVAYAGAAHALEAGGALRQIRRFAGSSAGAMAAAALCAGCTAGDVTSALLEIEFAQLLDAEQLSLPPALRDLAAAGSLSEAVAAMTRAFFDAISQQERAAEVARAAGPEEARPPLRRSASGSWSVADPLDVVRRLATEFGLFRGQVLEDRVEALLLRGTGLANVTFAQLRSHTGRELRVTATSVTRQRTVYFDADSTPDLRVALAVRASSAVPFLFAPVAIGGELFVDGGALKNMPLDAFAGGRALALSIRAPTQARGGGVAVPTLGASRARPTPQASTSSNSARTR
ncbi:acyl transferase/acyl hydrolase/lysophospholipase [Pelagophyceae sp. CCMP2097]|nr:acyl transferase/acyl hydrolase/lysophospholipase [Pelagophyceae sp. CCMP2097]